MAGYLELLTSPMLYVWVAIAGLLFGIGLQRGQLDPVQMFGDIIHQRNWWLARGFLVAIGVGIIGVGIISVATGGTIPQQKPSGLIALFGAFVFGIGAALASASAVSLPFKAGEGRLTAWVAMFGAFFAWVAVVPYMAKPIVKATKAAGGFNWPWSKPLLLPYAGDNVMLIYGVIFGALCLGTTYYLRSRIPKGGTPQANTVNFRKLAADGGEVVRERIPAVKVPMVSAKRLWDPRIAGIVAITGNLVFFLAFALYGKAAAPGIFRGMGPEVFTVSYAVWPLLGFNVPQWFPGAWWWGGTKALPGLALGTWAIMMAIVGAFIAASISGDFKIRQPPKGIRVKRYATAFVGGAFLAIGVRLALACDVAGWLTALAAQGNAAGFVYTLGMFPGMYFGFKIKRMLM